MTRQNSMIAVFALVVLGALALFVGMGPVFGERDDSVEPQEQRHDHVTVVQEVDDQAELRRQMAELRDLNIRLTDRLDRLEAEQPVHQDSPQEGSAMAYREPETIDLDQQDQIAEESSDAQAYLLDSQLDTGEQDSWAIGAEQQLMEHLADEAVDGIVLDSVKCVSSHCRVDVSVDADLVDQEVMHSVMEMSPWPSEFFFVVDDSENPSAVVYLAREGGVLPQPGS